MDREKAAEMLKRLNYDCQNGADENDRYYEMYIDALETAITALEGPWVKTSDRLPDKYDGTRYYVSTTEGRFDEPYTMPGWLIIDHPELCEFWAPIPPLPEVKK